MKDCSGGRIGGENQGAPKPGGRGDRFPKANGLRPAGRPLQEKKFRLREMLVQRRRMIEPAG